LQARFASGHRAAAGAKQLTPNLRRLAPRPYARSGKRLVPQRTELRRAMAGVHSQVMRSLTPGWALALARSGGGVRRKPTTRAKRTAASTTSIKRMGTSQPWRLAHPEAATGRVRCSSLSWIGRDRAVPRGTGRARAPSHPRVLAMQRRGQGARPRAPTELSRGCRSVVLTPGYWPA